MSEEPTRALQKVIDSFFYDWPKEDLDLKDKPKRESKHMKKEGKADGKTT